jgi:hypothetical protein
LDSALAHIVWRRPSCSGWQLLSKRSRSPAIGRGKSEGRKVWRVERASSSVRQGQLHCMLQATYANLCSHPVHACMLRQRCV